MGFKDGRFIKIEGMVEVGLRDLERCLWEEREEKV